MRTIAPVFAALALLAASAAASAAPAAPDAGAPPAAPAVLTGPQVGQPAPAFTLKTIDGRTVTLDTYKGKTLVLNVWATWCPPCRGETPDLISSYAALAAPNVVFLGVDDTELAPIVRAFVAAKGVKYPQAIDSDKSFSTAYDIRYFPTTFVIDPNGVIRARNIDVVTPQMLHDFVAAAAAGHNASTTSPQQQKIDALLAQPYALTGDHDAIVAGVKKVDDAINQAEDLMSDGDATKGTQTDLLRTHAEEATLRDRAIVAFAPVATSDADKMLLARLRGDAGRDREQWNDALTAYDAALAIDPKNEDALSGVAFVAGPLKLYDRAVDADTRIAALHPDDVDGLLELVAAQAAAKQFAQSAATSEKATALALAHLAAKPGTAALIRKVAATHLVAGRAYVKAGDTDKARTEFAQMEAWTLKLPKTDFRYAMYLEEAQEAQVALDLTASATTRVSLSPWTGADLPGSVASTMKYRLVVAGSAGKNVDLKAAGVPKGWVASFCTDKVCAPFKVSVALPPSGVKVIEFQLVPPGTAATAPKVRVIGTDGVGSATATT